MYSNTHTGKEKKKGEAPQSEPYPHTMGSAVDPKSSNLALFTIIAEEGGSSLANARFSAFRMNFCGENWPWERVSVVNEEELLRAASTAHGLGRDAAPASFGAALWNDDNRIALNESDQLSCQNVSPCRPR